MIGFSERPLAVDYGLVLVVDYGLVDYRLVDYRSTSTSVHRAQLWLLNSWKGKRCKIHQLIILFILPY